MHLIIERFHSLAKWIWNWKRIILIWKYYSRELISPSLVIVGFKLINHLWLLRHKTGLHNGKPPPPSPSLSITGFLPLCDASCCSLTQGCVHASTRPWVFTRRGGLGFTCLILQIWFKGLIKGFNQGDKILKIRFKFFRQK